MDQGRCLVVVSLAAAGMFLPGVAIAQPAAEFYQGKQIDMFIGTPGGGGYDQYGRLLGRHMSRHIPGAPTFVFKNMPAGGGRQAMNHVYNVAPRDGTAFGITIRNIAFDPLMGVSATLIEGLKLNWIGSLNNEIPVCVSWHATPFRTVADTRKAEIVMGSSGPTASDSVHAKMLNHIAGSRIRIVLGYKGSGSVHLAMEKGEVQGRCGLGWDSIVSRYPHWIKEKKINVLAQFGMSKHRDLPNMPLILDFAKTDEHRQLADLLLAPLEMGRPFFAPPGVPKDRIALLRRAFDATVKDPEFLADAEKQHVGLHAISGDAVQKLVQRIYSTPKPVVAIGRQLSSGK
ncbi:MAG: Bug family tripartite tricarboxylate transporter substrate binding protein [Xanthobacteraceae bacterium]